MIVSREGPKGSMKLCCRVQKVNWKREDGGYTELGNSVPNELTSMENTGIVPDRHYQFSSSIPAPQAGT